MTRNWTAAANATGYRVLRSSTSGGPYSAIGTTAGTTYTATNVSAGNRYYYGVQSTAGGWSSANSTEASATAPLTCL